MIKKQDKKIPLRFQIKSKNSLIEAVTFLIVLFAILALIPYYLGKFTRTTDVAIVILLFLLSIDSFLYIKHTQDYKKQYYFLSFLFLVVAIVHGTRFFLGPIHCSLNEPLSVYLYNIIALLMGIFLVYLSTYLMKRHSGPRYHHIAGIIIGAAMIIIHSLKIIIGKCV